MNDRDALEFLAAKLKTSAAVAAVLGVTDQRFFNWKARNRIGASKRPAVWAMVNDRGGNLPREWLLDASADNANPIPSRKRRVA